MVKIEGKMGLCDGHGIFEDGTTVIQEMEVKTTFPLSGHALSAEIQQKSFV